MIKSPTIELFGRLKSIPKDLRDAAAVLGADKPPHDELCEAVRTLWLAGLKRQAGASEATIRRAVQDLTFAVFNHADSEVKPKQASRVAGTRMIAHMNAERDGKVAKKPSNGDAKE